MNNLIKISIAFGLVIYLFSFGMTKEVVAQTPCDSNWTNIIDTVTVNGCDYEVDLCLLCRYSYPGEVRINSYRNLDTCETDLNANEIGQSILTQISTYAYLFFDNCQYTVYPCDGQQREEITYSIPICWKVKLEEINPPNFDIYNNKYQYIPCGGAYCKATYSYCMDEYGQLQKTITVLEIKDGPINCSIEGENLVYPINTIGEESDCYILHTACNP